MIKVFITDDHDILREGLKEMIEKSSNIKVCGQAGNGEETFKKILKENYDVLLLDISLPDMNGLEILKQVKIIKPSIKVLILTTHAEGQYAIRALQAGAAGYLTKRTLSQELIEAIERVSKGGKYITPSVAEDMAFNFDNSIKKNITETLSDREYEVMCMIAKGKSSKEMAEYLSLSVKTVSTYKDRLLKKMNMKNNAEIIRYAIEKGLIE